MPPQLHGGPGLQAKTVGLVREPPRLMDAIDLQEQGLIPLV